METEVKKKMLRMIPYGLYVLTAQNKEGKVIKEEVCRWFPRLKL